MTYIIGMEDEMRKQAETTTDLNAFAAKHQMSKQAWHNFYGIAREINRTDDTELILDHQEARARYQIAKEILRAR